MATTSLNNDDYQIGIVCALHIEWAAMIAMLDQEHASLPKDKADSNEDTFGSIGEHNVIIACLPAGSMGTTPAATVAGNMLRSFSIKFGLMVGIGGGVWSKSNDIRLGDIVVRQPTGKHGGVVQWDEGHAKEGRLERRGQLDRPPKVLLHALQSLKTKGEMEELGISTALEYMATNKPKMAKGPNKYTYPALVDRLFKASYPHTTDDNSDDNTCDKCDTEETTTREDREDLQPEIFYGNIVSGNSVMKNSKQRDDIAKQEEVLCFEMEAAGLMNNFPCLVIRGIADYSDSHKNKMWQRYAAATAAAFARVFLGFVDKQKLVETPSKS
ncbi:hypothetical protein HYALB_00008672 [Hymenoscyphus albidus]|uniref:Nucleoside phosphorylase domain-containing protein n=1 Tax=Hymenoscyphus albidus TaxID=595503 RepID=A0A9N9Q4E3_9HELO|nr:hypothetical protein HYALB_00008672 [Hymenoscyphus albidus]